MDSQISSDAKAKEKLIAAINTTKKFLNHEFLNYVKTTNSISPSEWTWVVKPYSIVSAEKPNLPDGLYSKLENLYTNVFQLEADKFMDMMRRFSEQGITVLRGENAREFDLQYDKWRTNFTKEANRVINELEGRGNNLVEQNIKSLKELVKNGEFDSVINRLIEEYTGFFKEQNILYGLSFRVNSMKKDIMYGIVSSSEERIEQSKIIHALLTMIDGLVER